MKSELCSFLIVSVLFISILAEKNVTTLAAKKTRVSVTSTSLHDVSEGNSTSRKWRQPTRDLWISQVFYEARKSFELDPNVTGQCRKSFDSYTRHLHNQTVWAVRMMESSEWPSTGLLAGKVTYPGDWDGCHRAHGPNIRSQYCLVQAFVNISSNAYTGRQLSTGIQWPSEDSSAWDTIETYVANPDRIDRRYVSWALCLPSSCSVNDLWKSLNHTLKPAFRKHDLDVEANVNPLLCSVQGGYSYSFGFYCACAVFSLIIVLVVTSSLYDIFGRTEGESAFWLLKKCFKCFSVRQNSINLMYYDSPASTNPGIYLIKICCFALIVHGNRVFSNLSVPTTSQMESIEMMYSSKNILIISFEVVDIFFMISGFLTFYSGFLSVKEQGFVYLPLSVLLRWLRLMTVFGLVLLFVIQILPILSDGPWWNHRISSEVEICRRAWLFDVLAMNNFANPREQCLLISWYLSADIQLAILGAILMLITIKNKKIGITAILVTFFMASELLGITVYKKKYLGIPRLFLRSLRGFRDTGELHKLYTSTASRIAPYLIGFSAALLTNILKAKRYTFSARQTTLIPLGLFVIGVVSISYGLILHNSARRYRVFEHVIYAVVHRSLFVLPVASLLCIYFTSGLGKLNRIFEMKIFIPFGRLVYSACLVHYIIQLYYVSSQRELSLVPEMTNQVYWWISDVVCSYVVAFFVYIAWEGPMCSIIKFSRSFLTRKPIRTSNRPQQETIISQNGFQNTAYEEEEVMTPQEEMTAKERMTTEEVSTTEEMSTTEEVMTPTPC